ncbi:UDP-glucuronic acid decarboxylase family protein [uncultured Methanobrevibacter sp.]|uniref:UDP-glucuronic acid decarboxylase family protein n=1 Tax=uncultured Methanobrevibacter sp. TaxID=253161 RepID=UPI0025EFAD12|nr:UDP-glucuronic acid decarboxylase family protein [uncultured Methanobrevibacter sp.]
MKTILIAGGAGFIGTNLIKKLLKEGNKIISIDNFHTGKIENIENISSEKFKFIKHDIINPLPINDKIDEIYNLASPASPPHYQAAPLQTIKTNIYGVFNLLDLAKENDAKFLQTSTSEVYGEPLEHPQKESYWGNVNPNGYRSCYDESKRCSESICMNYYREYNTKIKIVRIFNTYGPYMDPKDGRVVTNFIIQALKNEDITIYGDGSQTRSFCYVDDMIDGLIKMMSTTDDFTGPVNLGNPREFSILEFAKKIIKKTDSSSKIINCPLPYDDPTQRKPNIELAKEILKWEPKIMLNEGLDKTIRYYKKIICKD